MYKAVIKWVRHNESGRKHLLPELLSLVRLVYISQDYLNEEIKAEPLVCSNPECELKMILNETIINNIIEKYRQLQYIMLC